MSRAFNIAPRVVVYPLGTAVPELAEGWLALPVLGTPPPAAPAAPQPHRAVFGDGSHPTTRLCASAVDLLCRQRPGLAVLDVGTGTGILARIARARGANFVVGTDIDPVAVAYAKAHVELDGYGDIHFGDETPDHWGARFDLVVANILEAPLLTLAPALRRALRPDGILLISGFTRPQAPALRHGYEAAGLKSVGDFDEGEWVLLKLAD